jgi:hypothetical protein
MQSISLNWPQLWIIGYVAFAMLMDAIIGVRA